MKEIFFIVGEASGDALGAKLIKALKAQSPEPLNFTGIGGPLMEAEGFESLLPMDQLCVMGIWEVVGQLPRLLRLINGVVEEIEKRDPVAVITIDLPDFNFNVAARLKKRGKTKAKRIHYVAPSVWAWRPKRAETISKFLDGLICLFPFEPPLFEKHKLQSAFAGHPLAENDFMSGDGAQFRAENDIKPEVKTLGLFFGSRAGEIASSSQTLLEAATIIKSRYPDLHIIAPTLPHLRYDIAKLLEEVGCPVFIVTEANEKWNAFAACDAAIAVSGTVALELAAVGTPHVITYKMHPATWIAVKLLSKAKFAHLGNILLDEAAFPEYLQSKADPIEIARGILRLYDLEEERTKQFEKTQKLREKLGAVDEKSPSSCAADFVLSMIASGAQ